LEKEKPVVVNEINKNLSNPKRVIQTELVKMLMKGTNMEKTIAGPIKNVKGFKRELLMKYLNFFYEPSKCVLSIAGHVSKPNHIINLIEQYFTNNKRYLCDNNTITNYKRQKYNNLLNITIKNSKYEIKYLKKTLDTSYVTVGFIGYKLNTRNSIILDLISIILCGYMSSRLYKRLRNELSIIYNISNNIENLEDCGYYYMMCGTQNVKLCIEEILKQLNILKEVLVNDKELKRAKEYINGSNQMNKNDSSSLAAHYGYNIMYYDKIITIEELLKQTNSVTSDEIKKLANEIFVPNNLKICYMGSKKHNIKNLLK